MRALIHISLVLISFGFMGCEDVIIVDVPSELPRLIIDALIRVDTSEAITVARVKVSETNAFFENLPPAGLQQITLTGLEGGLAAVLLEEEPGSGIYSKEVSTASLLNEEIFLQIDFNDEFFVAYARFVPTVPIEDVTQGDGTLFGEEDTEIIVSFTDFPDRTDFYVFDFDFGNFLVSDDEFYQGQPFQFSYFYEDGLAPGTIAEIGILGADEEFFRYMELLIAQSEGDFGPFETPSVTARGNIINATTIDNDENFDNVNTSDNFALGYFAIVQEYKTAIEIE